MKNSAKEHTSKEMVNQYKGKTPEQIWSLWKKEQRHHFLYDHLDEFLRKDYDEREFDNLTDSYYKDLPEDIRQSLKGHIMMSSYKEGGKMKYYNPEARTNKLERISQELLPGGWRFEKDNYDTYEAHFENIYKNGPLTAIISKSIPTKQDQPWIFYFINFYGDDKGKKYQIHITDIFPLANIAGDYGLGIRSDFKNDAQANLRLIDGMRKATPEWWEKNKEKLKKYSPTTFIERLEQSRMKEGGMYKEGGKIATEIKEDKIYSIGEGDRYTVFTVNKIEGNNVNVTQLKNGQQWNATYLLDLLLKKVKKGKVKELSEIAKNGGKMKDGGRPGEMNPWLVVLNKKYSFTELFK